MLTQEMINELREAAQLGTSLTTEYWTVLLDLYSYVGVASIPEELELELTNEIVNQYNYFKQNFQIVEEEITIVSVVKRLNELL